MNKEEFLNKLRSKLEVLEEAEVDDIINEYSEHIDEKVKKKISEEDAIAEFGDIDELVSGILSAYKVNQNFAKKNNSNFVDEFIDNCKEVFDKLIKIVSHGTVKEIFYLCIYILIIILILLIVRVPFEILDDGIESIMYSFPEPLYEVFNVLEKLLINIVYVALVVVIFIKILKEKLLDGVNFVYEEKEITVKETKKDSKKEKVKDSSNEEKVIVKKEEHTKIKYKNERTFFDSIGDLLKIVFRGFACLISIPFVICVVCLAVCLALAIMFSIEYKFFIGPILAIIGCLVICIVISEALLSFVFKKEIKFARLFISFIVSLIISGIGVGYSLFEISSLTFKNLEDTSKVLIREDVYEYNNEIIDCYYCEKVDIKIDNTLKDNEVKVQAYSFDYQNITVDEDSYTYYDDDVHYTKDHISYIVRVDLTKLFNKVKDDLKNNELYIYDDYAPAYLVVYVNENTYDIIKENIKY